MRFTVEVKDFSNTLKLIASIVPTGGTGFTSALVLQKDGLWIYANNDTVTLKCKARGVSDVEGKGIAGIDLLRLDKVIKGRDKITFENKDTIFTFKAVKTQYGGDIAIIPVVKDTIDGYDDNMSKGKKAELSVLDAETFNRLRAALAATNISLIHESDTLDTYVMLKKGVLEVVSSDNFHLAHYKVACGADLNFQLSPTKTVFDTLGKLSDFFGGETKVEFATEAIKAFNKEYSICTPTIQSSNTSFLRAKQFISEMPKPMCSFTLKISETTSALDNIMSVHEDGALISAELESGKKGTVLTFAMKTTMGRIADKITIDDLKGKPFKCTLDPRIFMDSLAISKAAKADFAFIEGKAIVLKCKRDDADVVYVNSVVNE